jgi:hypothetical protein
MRSAASVVWKQKLGDSVDENISFFEKGDVFKLKQGAAGEFATALLFQYLTYVLGNTSQAHQVAKITGDDASNGA